MELVQRERPKLVYICNPNNPTGELVPEDTIGFLLKANPEVLFLIDEAYVEFSGGAIDALVNEYGNLIVSRTFSKAFGLANFRIGYLVSSIDNIRLLTDARNSKNISTFAQVAALSALEDRQSMDGYVKQVREGREYLKGELKKLSYVGTVYDSTANFVMFELENNRYKWKLIEFLKRNGIYVRDVGQTGYIREHCVRITAGTRKQMETVVKKMREFCL